VERGPRTPARYPASRIARSRQPDRPCLTALAAGWIDAATGLAGLGIGFYDGLVGPGTGTFLVLGLVTASATAKIVNCRTSAGALAGFAWQGAVLRQSAALMAVLTLAGGTLGARTALKKGSGSVRVVLLTVVFALVAKTAWEQWAA
jgi:uncharacterized membrane protein YfcA